jgi:hypothetical protein
VVVVLRMRGNNLRGNTGFNIPFCCD